MAHPPGFTPAPQRHALTIENTTGGPVKLPRVGDQQFSLAPGDNSIPVAYWHRVGGDGEINTLIARGELRAVCRQHVFRDAEDRKPGNAMGVCHFCCLTGDEQAAALEASPPPPKNAAPQVAAPVGA